MTINSQKCFGGTFFIRKKTINSWHSCPGDYEDVKNNDWQSYDVFWQKTGDNDENGGEFVREEWRIDRVFPSKWVQVVIEDAIIFADGWIVGEEDSEVLVQ